MIKICCFLFLLTGINADAFAQKKQIIELLPGETTLEGLQSQIFMYPGFTNAVVNFKNGNNGKGRMNYCLVSNEMQFLSPKGDTLALTGESDISLITIGQDSFYYNGTAFLRQSKNFGSIKTASFQTIKEVGRKQIGGYGETVTGVAKSLSATTISHRFVELRSGDIMILSKETHYFIGDSAGNFLPLNRQNVYSTLNPEQQKELNKYQRKNQVNFQNLDDVEKALTAVIALIGGT